MATPPHRQNDAAQEWGGPRRSRRVAVPVGLYKHAVAVFLAALVLFIIATPFAQSLADPGLLEGALLTGVLICGVLAVGGRRDALVLAALLGVPALGAKWFNHFRPDLISPNISQLLGVMLLVVVAYHLLRYILRAPRVDSEVISAAVATYLVLALIWTLLYVLAASLIPNAFVLSESVSANKTLDGFSALYFSFITLCTVGYGDITPGVPVVRMLAVLEGITGVLYMSVLIARLVAIYSSDRE